MLNTEKDRLSSVKFSIRKKLILVFTSVILSLVLFVSVFIGYRVKKSDIASFQKNVLREMKLTERGIRIFFGTSRCTRGGYLAALVYTGKRKY